MGRGRKQLDLPDYVRAIYGWYFSAQNSREVRAALRLSPRQRERREARAEAAFRALFSVSPPEARRGDPGRRALAAFRFMFDPNRKYLYAFRRRRGTSEDWARKAQRRYYQRHRDELLAKLREKRKRDRERYREYQRKWSQDPRSRNKHLRRYRRYYEKHRQQRLEYRRKYYQEHREEILEKKRERDRLKKGAGAGDAPENV